MIQALVELGKRIRENSDALKEEPFAVYLSIDGEGRFRQFIPTEKKKVWVEALLSKKGSARLLLDKCEEVLGVGNKPEKKHELFLAKQQEYADVEAMAPVLAFYRDEEGKGLTAAREAFEEQVDQKLRGENIAFMVDDRRLCDDKRITEAVISHYEARQAAQMKGKARRCSICGRTDYPVVDRPHGMLKRVPNGQTSGCALVSYNNNAFESYGLKGNENSSICTACARNYVEAMNYLLCNGYTELVEGKVEGKKKEVFRYSNRHNIGSDTAALFWTREPVPDEIDTSCINDDNIDENFIKGLFESAGTAQPKQPGIVDENMFYCCTISGVAARVAVRDWIAISLSEYKRNLAKWFEDIDIIRFGKIRYLPLFRLIAATRGRSTDTKVEARIGAALWKAAFKGSPVPLTVLSAVLRRVFTCGQNMTAEHAALIKLILNRHDKNSKKMEPQLDLNNDSAPYLCGRLFAVIENIQQAAMGYNLNRTVKDRFFSAAATLPSVTFGRMLKLAQSHQIKLRRDKPGAYVKLDRQLTSIMGMIPAFPERLSPAEQGQFALGYYHQKEYDDNARKEKENNDQTKK